VCDGIGGQGRAITDALGNYILHPPAQTNGMVTVTKEGYRIVRNTSLYSYHADISTVQNYNLHPDSISGKIINRNGEPLEGVKITFEQNGGLTGVQIAFTDQNGNYKYTVPTDNQNYWITIMKEGYQNVRTQWYMGGGQIYNYTLQ